EANASQQHKQADWQNYRQVSLEGYERVAEEREAGVTERRHSVKQRQPGRPARLEIFCGKRAEKQKCANTFNCKSEDKYVPHCPTYAAQVRLVCHVRQ